MNSCANTTGRISCTVVLLLAGVCSAPVAAQDPAASTGEAICGPRCVEFVLNWYDRPVEVSDLIWELQGGQSDRQVSASALDAALKKRGIHTQLVRISEWKSPTWSYPALLHMRNENGSGHFVVWVPPSEGKPSLLWDNGAGFTKALTPSQSARLSGVAILTSREPFPDGPEIEVGSGRPLATLNSVGGGLILGIGIALLVWRTSRRTRIWGGSKP